MVNIAVDFLSTMEVLNLKILNIVQFTCIMFHAHAIGFFESPNKSFEEKQKLNLSVVEKFKTRHLLAHHDNADMETPNSTYPTQTIQKSVLFLQSLYSIHFE